MQAPTHFPMCFPSCRSGSKLVLVGDPDQLPPVGYGFPLKDLLACGLIPQIILKEIFRQAAGSAIITSAYNIKEGRLPMDLWRWRVLPTQAAVAGCSRSSSNSSRMGTSSSRHSRRRGRMGARSRSSSRYAAKE